MEVIIIVVLAFIGLIMASIGIDFYNKCKKDEKLSAHSRNFLVLLLVVFILIIVGTIGWTITQRSNLARGMAEQVRGKVAEWQR